MRALQFFVAVVMLPVLCACQEKPAATQPVVVADSPEQSLGMLFKERGRKAFEKKIDFDRAVLNHVVTEKIVFDWKKIGVPEHLDGWKPVSRDYIVLDGKDAREFWEWHYTKNDRGVSIEVTSYKTGNQDALLAIRDFAHKSSMIEPPYSKGPADLGTISVKPDHDYGGTLYWAYRDLQFKVSASDKYLALNTAYWLQSIAEAHRQPR